ncbi:MAG: hypothetical protein WCJ39_04840 [bacterium]
MKKQKIYLWLAMIIVAISFSACDYPRNNPVKKERVSLIQWDNKIPDSIRKEIIRFFNLIGLNEELNSTKVLQLKNEYLPGVPDSLIKNIPDMYYKWIKGNTIWTITSSNTTIPPTWDENRKYNYHVEVLSANDLRTGTIDDIRVMMDPTLVIFIIFFYVVFFIAILASAFDEKSFGKLCCLFLIEIALAILCWFVMAKIIVIWIFGITLFISILRMPPTYKRIAKLFWKLDEKIIAYQKKHQEKAKKR